MAETTAVNAPGWRDVRDEITGRVQAMREPGDSSIQVPLLLLGVAERVGSNWVSDSLLLFYG